MEPPPPSSPKKCTSCPGTRKKSGYKKYSDGTDSPFLSFITNQSAPVPHEGPAFLRKQSARLIHASLAATTWKKYSTGWKCFENFEAFSRQRFTWPLNKEVLRSFAVFCISVKNLKPASVRSYFLSLVCLHKLRGFTTFEINNSMVDAILRGAGNLLMSSPNPPTNTRRVVTIPVLRHLGHKLSSSGWSAETIQNIWTAALLAFFGSMRMGELLSPREDEFDPTATFTWACVKYRPDNSFLLHIKMPKMGTVEGEFVDIFPFPNLQLCPVSALRRHHSLQAKLGRAQLSDPVFSFPSGKLLTPAAFNSSLRSLLSDICDFKRDTISGHSFRAGIPSAVARCPDLMSSDDIKNWGRWASSTYQRYTRLKNEEKAQIFKKIVTILS